MKLFLYLKNSYPNPKKACFGIDFQSKYLGSTVVLCSFKFLIIFATIRFTCDINRNSQVLKFSTHYVLIILIFELIYIVSIGKVRHINHLQSYFGSKKFIFSEVYFQHILKMFGLWLPRTDAILQFSVIIDMFTLHFYHNKTENVCKFSMKLWYYLMTSAKNSNNSIKL